MTPGFCVVRVIGEDIATGEGDLLSGIRLELPGGDVADEVPGGEFGGCGGYVDAVDVEGWKGWAEQGVQQEGYAACACAEVEDAEGARGG